MIRRKETILREAGPEQSPDASRNDHSGFLTPGVVVESN
jgi:hypothetical protein